ncbi:MAG: aminopeptidase P family N-terminal domain-containing protein, partial [Planctomycetota bacterium]
MAKRSSTTDLHRERLKRLRNEMEAASIDHLLVTNLPDIAYLTGFMGSSAVLIVSPTGKPTLVTDGRYAEASQALRPVT